MFGKTNTIISVTPLFCTINHFAVYVNSDAIYVHGSKVPSETEKTAWPELGDECEGLATVKETSSIRHT
jgi:hypothetical protein